MTARIRSAAEPVAEPKGTPVDRRTFLGAIPLAAAAASAVLSSSCRVRDPGQEPAQEQAREQAGGGSGRLGAIGVQLYTVRSLTRDDLEGTLGAIAEIGYEEVELAGLFGRDPVALRQLLDGFGLRVASSHQSIGEVREGWQTALEGALVLGQSHVVVPSLPGGDRTPDGLRAVADELNRAGEAAREAGLRFGYHNHAWEFEPFPNGTLPLDLLRDRCDPELVALQLDIYWAAQAGVDPLAQIEAQPGRVTTVHAKDRRADGEMTDVGWGTLDFATILGRAMELGLEHVIVEHDQPSDPLGSIRNSYEGLRALRL